MNILKQVYLKVFFGTIAALGICALSVPSGYSQTTKTKNETAAEVQQEKDASAAETEEQGGAETDETDVGWPREVKSDQGVILIYQPQFDALVGPDLKGRAAFSIKKKEDGEPEFGALWFEARISPNAEERLAYVDSVKVTQVALPDADDATEKKIAEAIEKVAKEGAATISLDRLTVALKEAETERKEAEGLDHKAPKIIISEVPAVLLFIDGKPKFSAVENTDLLAMENSPFPIVLDPKSKKYYLNGGELWYEAADVKGPWKYVEKVPEKVGSLVKLTDEQKKDLKELVSGEGEDDRIPAIVYTDVPTELIVVDGKPKFTPSVGAELLYVENSETSIFLDPGTKSYYVLLSGRWYKNSALKEDGWDYVPSNELPEAFAKIPEDSDRSAALAQVAGTKQAEEAVAEASIPQVTAVSREKTKLEVKYNGKPQFEKIKGTDMLYAVNTASTVLKIDGRYYAVDQGVWFVADAPTGPWVVADEVPAKVENIPPENPTYNVKYVKVYDSTPEYVYVGYTPGYLGSYIYNGTVVYGTGYYYRSWWGSYYYPRPLTWCLGAFFRPWYGWGYSLGWGRFAFHAGFAAGYAWHRNRYRGWYGPGGYYSHRYNRYRARHHRAAHYRHRNNLYNRPANRNRNQFNRNRPRHDQLRKNFKGAGKRPNNVFTDRKGNVYRKTKDGWQKRDGKKWKQTKLDRDARPGNRDRRPGNLDKANRPNKGNRLPNAGGGNRPNAKPGQRPNAKPGQRPNAKPGQRPNAKPGQRPQKPATRPAKKPQKPAARPAQKPKKKPAARPAQRPKKAAKPKARPKKQVRKQPQRRPSSGNRNRARSHSLQRQSRARSRGGQRHRSHSAARRRPSGGARRGGGGRRGGGRRR
ncbi:MAG: hypothetical protein ACR2OJ_11685 [Hyphomicrobiales bacterium]